VGIFGQKSPKNIKTLKNSMKPDRNEGFEHEKPYHKPPEYPGYDVKISPQHGVSDPLKSISPYLSIISDAIRLLKKFIK
jgi:hypothetical protein